MAGKSVFACMLMLLCLISSHSFAEVANPDPILELQNSLAETKAQVEAQQTNLNHIWTLSASALVLLMQVGFLMLEAGYVRSKNSISVAQKNISDFLLASIVFYLVGFGLMFGTSYEGIVGGDNFFWHTADDWHYTFFVFQCVFVGTAATIMSGAVAERMKFEVYLVSAVFVSAVVYPIYGHWAWGNLLNTENSTLLSSKGFIDFAGSTVVHSVGGWIGLAAIIVLGPRLGKFNEDGSANRIQGHSMVLATGGAMILWIGWVGFNGGSTTMGTSAVAKIVANTLIAAVFGGSVCMLLGKYKDGLFLPSRPVNGSLAGLVGVTAGCDAIDPLGAVIIGLICGALVIYSEEFIEKVLKLDDVVGAVSVHGTSGLVGTLLVASLALPEKLLAASRWEQFWIQLYGVTVAFIWAFGLSYLFFKVLNYYHPIRVSRGDEERGLNETEHGATLGTAILQKALKNITKGKGNLSVRLDESSGDESADIARIINPFLERVEKMHSMTSDYAAIGLDSNLKVVFINDAAEKQIENLGYDFQLFLNNDLVALCPELHDEVQKLSKGTGDSARVLASVKQEWVEFIVRKIQTNDGDEFVVNFSLVTEKVNSENALKMARMKIQEVLQSVSRGDLSNKIDLRDFDGFYLDLAKNINDLIDSIVVPFESSVKVLKAVSQGNLTCTMQGSYEGSFLEMQSSLNVTIDNLQQMVGQIKRVVDSLMSTSESIFEGNNEIASGAKMQLTRLEDALSKVSDVARASEENADQATHALKISTDVSHSAEDGMNSMQETIKAINEIVNSSGQVEAIIEVIDEIAFQTNLLALNASVEAARAGDAGKGFAVVATEVRSLASRSADAAKKIRDIISQSIENVKSGSNTTKKSSEVLEKITESVATLAKNMEDINKASAHQAEQVSDINHTFEEFDELAKRNATLVNESSKSAEELKNQATILANMMSAFVLDENEAKKRLVMAESTSDTMH